MRFKALRVCLAASPGVFPPFRTGPSFWTLPVTFFFWLIASLTPTSLSLSPYRSGRHTHIRTHSSRRHPLRRRPPATSSGLGPTARIGRLSRRDVKQSSQPRGRNSTEEIGRGPSCQSSTQNRSVRFQPAARSFIHIFPPRKKSPSAHTPAPTNQQLPARQFVMHPLLLHRRLAYGTELH